MSNNERDSLRTKEVGAEPAVDDGTKHLDSWKDIAAFFHRSVRTVQRWERLEDIPVHRHVHHSGMLQGQSAIRPMHQG